MVKQLSKNKLQEYKDSLALNNKFIATINAKSKLDIIFDDMTGTLYVSINDKNVYATPFWEDSKGLAIQVYSNEYDVLDSKDIKFDVTGDIEKDATLYVELLEKYINENN